MDLQKLKIRSGIMALVTFPMAFGLLLFLSEILVPDQTEPIRFDTYHGLGGVVLSFFIFSLVCLATWVVLMFTDTDQPDILDSKTRRRVVFISASFCFLTGLAFYSDYYFLMAFFMPMASGIYIDHLYRRRYPASLLRAYTNLSVLFGMILGYVVATILIWNKLDEMTGGTFLGKDTYSQDWGVIRVLFFVVIYVFISFAGMLVGEERKNYVYCHSEDEYPEFAKAEVKSILVILAVLALSLVIIHLIPWEGRFYLMWDAIALFFAVLLMATPVVRLIAIYGK